MNVKIDAGQIFVDHSTKMNIVAQLILGDRQEAEDAVADVFADVANGKISLQDDKVENISNRGRIKQIFIIWNYNGSRNLYCTSRRYNRRNFK